MGATVASTVSDILHPTVSPLSLGKDIPPLRLRRFAQRVIVPKIQRSRPHGIRRKREPRQVDENRTNQAILPPFRTPPGEVVGIMGVRGVS
jgi:hypothetical protein